MKKSKENKNPESKLQAEIDEFFAEADSTCSNCGNALKTSEVNLEDIEHGKLFIIEKVPALVCESCGEIWVPRPFMDEFNEMIQVVKKFKKKKK